MSWYLEGIVGALICWGMAALFGHVVLTKDPPLWGALLLWPGIAALAGVGVSFVAAMVRNHRRVRREAGRVKSDPDR